MPKGFTLIELLVVVLIIGILAAAALPKYQMAVDKSRFSSLFPLVKALASAQSVYIMANGSPARSFADLDADLPSDCVKQTDSFYGEKASCGRNMSYNLDSGTHRVQGRLVLSDRTTAVVGFPTAATPQAHSFVYCQAYGNGAKQLCMSMGGVFRYKDGDSDIYQIF